MLLETPCSNEENNSFKIRALQKFNACLFFPGATFLICIRHKLLNTDICSRQAVFWHFFISFYCKAILIVSYFTNLWGDFNRLFSFFLSVRKIAISGSLPTRAWCKNSFNKVLAARPSSPDGPSGLDGLGPKNRSLSSARAHENCGKPTVRLFDRRTLKSRMIRKFLLSRYFHFFPFLVQL